MVEFDLNESSTCDWTSQKFEVIKTNWKSCPNSKAAMERLKEIRDKTRHLNALRARDHFFVTLIQT